jgi:sulfite reductase (NADPH) flavoprotein alpha-component
MKQIYDRTHPYKASIKMRYGLCKEGSFKDTRHIILDLADSGLQYQVGDSIGVYPVNDPEVIENTLRALKTSGKELVKNREGRCLELAEFLKGEANLKGISKKMLLAVKDKLSEEAGQPLNEILRPENKDTLKKWMHEHEVWDLLAQFPDAKFTAQEIVDLSMPLLPRFYSIASSQAFVGNEVHLTVAYLEYETRGIVRMGVCTHYLCHLAPLNEAVLPIYIQPSTDFRLPQDGAVPMIMIGPGTGVAPFRAFMQEREKRGDTALNWLFFGEWTQSGEFFYEEEWKRWIEQGRLKLDTAFSRDQPEKIYVQNKMRSASKELFRWLKLGAVLYVCGDADYMAKDVDTALHEIISTEGQMTSDDAKAYVKKMRQEKRYLRDVY